MVGTRSRRVRPVDRVDQLVDLAVGKEVLHLGCTNWPYAESDDGEGAALHRALHQSASRLIGVDSDPQGAEDLNRRGLGPVTVGDAERLDLLTDLGTFDLVIAGEIIEHLNNPGQFLETVRSRIATGGSLVITTVNAYCAFRFVHYALRGRGGAFEPVHPDHVAYYSQSTLRVLLERHDFEIDHIAFYDVGTRHRPSLPRWLRLTNDLAVRRAPQLSDGLIVVARPLPR